MDQNTTLVNANDTVLHFIVCGCEVQATFAPVANLNVYQRVKQILVDTYTQKTTSSCEECSG